MKISLQHLASNANPMFNNLSYLSSHILYSSHNQIIIYNPSTQTSSVSLNINSSNIYPDKCNCVSSYEEKNGDCYVLGGYNTGHISLFKSEIGKIDQYEEWKLVALEKQESSVLLTKVFEVGDKTLLVTLNNNAELIIYRISEENKSKKLVELQKLKFPLNKISETVDLTIVHNNILLVIGSVDQLIHCYLSPLHQINFQYSNSLKGHQNSITKLTFNHNEDNLLLASSSKDGYIRIWKIAEKTKIPQFQKSLFELTPILYIYLQSILISHQNSVTNLAWFKFSPSLYENLVSTSLDCTINIWEYSSDNWNVKSKLGQLYGNKNAFFNLLISNQHKQIISTNYNGACYIWEYNDEKETWISKVSFNGHFDEVRGLEWSDGGEFLVTTSKDQTTRVLCKNKESGKYYQVSKAQVHGYDINCITLLKIKDTQQSEGDNKSKRNLVDLIVSGADEKIIRVLEPPSNVVNYINYFTNSELHLNFKDEKQEQEYIVDKSKTGGKLEYVIYNRTDTQVLGLMTKYEPIKKEKINEEEGNKKDIKIEGEEEEIEQEEIVEQQTALLPGQTNYSKPPTQDYLLKSTLWSQINKLYGHPFELHALATSNCGSYIASNCKSFTKDHAFTLIWNTKTWKILHTLSLHKSTVNDLCFSPSGMLLSVGKDRTFGLYNNKFELIHHKEIHLRAITSGGLSWDEKYVATGSRDKSVKVVEVGSGEVRAMYEVKEAVHAVRWSRGDYRIAIGTESGKVMVLEVVQGGEGEGKKIEIVHKVTVPDYIGHSATINGLRWVERDGETLLASCSNDHTVRVFKVQ